MLIKNVQIGGMEFIDINRDQSPCQLRTTLGSCVSLVLADEKVGVAGMSHILLASSQKGITDEPLKYGKNAFPILLLGMLSRGCHREDLSAWIAGGANMFPKLDLKKKYNHIGLQNIKCAEEFINSRDIKLIDSSVGGNEARTLTYNLPEHAYQIHKLR